MHSGNRHVYHFIQVHGGYIGKNFYNGITMDEKTISWQFGRMENDDSSSTIISLTDSIE